jgi:hypothetical protein
MHIYILYIFFLWDKKYLIKKNTYHLNNEFYFLSKLLNIKNLSVFNNKY